MAALAASQAALASPSHSSVLQTSAVASSGSARVSACAGLRSSLDARLRLKGKAAVATSSRGPGGRGRFVVSPRALDDETLVAIGVGLVGITVGIGIPIFYEIQVKGSEERENDQPCFPCKGTGAQTCRFCTGTGIVTVALGGDETETSQCINCEGKGSITCTTCQGSGTQPRYLDRREFKDDD